VYAFKLIVTNIHSDSDILLQV